MSLQNWLNNGWLTGHQSSSQEISNLLNVADRDLNDSQLAELSPDWRLNIAYNAALQLATAALAACGYRARREAHHFRVIQSLTLTIGADANLVSLFDRFRKKRNIGEYERAGLVSEQEVKEMFLLATNLRSMVEKWLKASYPEFLQE